MVFESTKEFDLVLAIASGDVAVAKHRGSVAKALVKGSLAKALAKDSFAGALAKDSVAEAWVEGKCGTGPTIMCPVHSFMGLIKVKPLTEETAVELPPLAITDEDRKEADNRLDNDGTTQQYRLLLTILVMRERQLLSALQQLREAQKELAEATTRISLIEDSLIRTTLKLNAANARIQELVAERGGRHDD